MAYPQINQEICVRCGECITICQESEHQALRLDDGYVQVEQARCVGCGLCRLVCPKQAIEIKQ